MASTTYLANRLKYHTASRIATQTGEALPQALNVDGHIVTTNKVWASPQTAFVNNSIKNVTESVNATNNLVSIFKSGPTAASASFWNGGTVWTNSLYPAVRLYENVPMTPVAGSDGKESNAKFQSFEILAAENGVDEGTTRITDWISPTSVADQQTGLPVAGYSGIPMYDGTALKNDPSEMWAESKATYEFVYIAGLLTFDPTATPQQKDTSNGQNLITITAFKYIGDYLEDTLTNINNTLGGNIGQNISEMLKNISGQLGDTAVSAVVESEKEARISGDTYLSSVLSGYTPENTVSAAIEALQTSAARYTLTAVDTTSGYASTYQLMQTVNGETTPVEGSIINIPKDQLLSSALYNPETESIDLIFNISGGQDVSNVSIPVSGLVHEYVGGNGIAVVFDENDPTLAGKTTISAEINTTDNDGKYLTLTDKGIGLSGITEVITAASGNANAGLTTLSTAIGEAYLSAGAVTNKFTELTGRIKDIEDLKLASVLSGFDENHTVTSEFVSLNNTVNVIKSNYISGATANDNTISVGKSDKVISLNVKVPSGDGNAIKVVADGLSAQAYKEGTNIAFGDPDENGVVPICGTFTFELSAATADRLGGVLSGGDIEVAADGTVTVVSASQLKHSFSVLGTSFDGSEDVSVTLTEGDNVRFTTNDNDTTISVVASGAVAEGDTGLVSGGLLYTEVSNLTATISSTSGEILDTLAEVSGNIIDEVNRSADELSGKISAAFVQDKVVVGTGTALSSSIYSIRAEGGQASDFATENSKVATEKNVSEYVDYHLTQIDGEFSDLLNDAQIFYNSNGLA